MFWFILFGVVSLALGIILGIKNNNFESFLFPILFGGMFTVAVGMIVNLAAASVIGYHYEEKNISNIASIQDNVQTSGSFFLGSGTIDSEAVFYFYEQDGDGYRLTHVPAYRSKIVESNESPHLVVSKAVGDHPFWGIPLNSHDNYTFYVPTGSILNNFNLDAK